MEAENKEDSIFEQENYDGGMGSGPLAAATDADEASLDDDEQQDDEAMDDEEDADLDA